jgi:hypothetical protein
MLNRNPQRHCICQSFNDTIVNIYINTCYKYLIIISSQVSTAGVLQMMARETHHPVRCQNPEDNPILLMLHSGNLLLILCTVSKHTYFDK